MDYSPPGFSVHGMLQARILEWVAIPFSRGSSQPRDQTWVSGSAGSFFVIWANTYLDFPYGSAARICLQCRRREFDPWVRKLPWRRKWQPTPVFMPGKCFGWRSLVIHRIWKELDMTEQLNNSYIYVCVCVCIYIYSIYMYTIPKEGNAKKLLHNCAHLTC